MQTLLHTFFSGKSFAPFKSWPEALLAIYVIVSPEKTGLNPRNAPLIKVI
jgi:hypothetical protein